MPLSMAHVGDVVTIIRIIGSESVRRHLTDLGFTAGERVTVVNKVYGNLIVLIRDTRVALDEKMADRIIV
ncbi:MAG: FeoA family protein [Anaerovoracaceae bacterium]|jgi:ferrous iron transport protein A